MQTKNADNLCMSRALVVGKAWAKGDERSYRKLKRGKKKSHMTPARKSFHELDYKSGSIRRKMFSPYKVCQKDLWKKKGEKRFLRRLQVITCFFFVSTKHWNSAAHSQKIKSKRIILSHHNHYFDLLQSLPRFFSRSYWCYACNKGFNEKPYNSCEMIYSSCLERNCLRESDAEV